MEAEQKNKLGAKPDTKNTGFPCVDTPNTQGNPVSKSKVAEREEEILAFWQKEKIFEKSLTKESPKGEFVFYDGPPFANGEPHYGHILASTIKDTVARYKTMRGFNVPRRWGWDCHGLPVENLVEKELGLKSKKDIENYGLEKFNESARESVMRYADLWRKQIPRFGRFVDMENDYRTMDTSYTESVWWVFSELYKKGLVYEGFKSMHLCPHCGTTLSNFEVAQGYKDITDISVYVKFQILNSNFQINSKLQIQNSLALRDQALPEKLKVGEQEEYLLAWTTTPWTLPGNVALAINPEMIYCKLKTQNLKLKTEDQNQKSENKEEILIVAKSRVETVLKNYEYEIVGEIKGSELVGKSYVPIFNYYSDDAKLKNHANGWKVYGADFVTTEDGTGIVHIAPAFGEDDLKLGQKENLPFVQHVGVDGKFKKETGNFFGIDVKPKSDDEKTRLFADISIIKYLQEHGNYFEKEKITHSYPHCWRCDTPLLNYATSSWFVKVTDIKDKLISANKKVNWIPSDVKEGRFGKWLEGARDWAVSRTRFWGAPIPVWRCDDCKKISVIGSAKDLALKNPPKNKYIVMRHGESENNLKHILDSDLNSKYHLTENGKKQVLESAKKLTSEKIDLIISSPILRAKETAEIVAEKIGYKNEIIFDEKIREIIMGESQGKVLEEHRKGIGSFENWYDTAMKDWESLKQVHKRVGEFLYGLEKNYSGKTILIITHGGPAMNFVAVAKGLNKKEFMDVAKERDYTFKNAEFLKLEPLFLPHNADFESDFHRPYIDNVVFPCECGKEMKRVPDVFDCWFESGSMPYGQSHYPFQNLEKFNPKGGLFKNKKGFPAEFIAEGLDQTRGWFYTMMVLGVALFGESPYKNVIVNGIVLAENGEKMSKRLKNYPDPMAVVNKYGMDAVRYYLLSSPVVSAEDLRFSEKGVDEVLKKNVNRLDNVLTFFNTYKNEISNSLAVPDLAKPEKLKISTNVLDIWILARLAETMGEMEKGFDEYKLDKAVRPMAEFIDDLSTWYLRRSRDRFKNRRGQDADRTLTGAEKELEIDGDNAIKTTGFVLENFAKMIAPIMPFYADYLYKQIGGEKESVHLEEWPESYLVDKEILSGMSLVRSFASIALMQRMENKIKVRQPLQSLSIKHSGGDITKYWGELKEILKDEINVKEIILDKNAKQDGTGIKLDINITPELREEGQERELVRTIQEMRKTVGLVVSDRPTLFVVANDSGKMLVEKYKNEIIKSTQLGGLKFEAFAGGTEVLVDEHKFVLTLKILN